MKPSGFRKTNHLAVIGFLLPFMGAGLTAVLVLAGQNDYHSLKFSLLYLILVPSILIAGIVFSIKAIPLIEERDDKDYVYSGLTLNIVFLLAYIISLLYFFPSLLR